jgi:hypothetical protein
MSNRTNYGLEHGPRRLKKHKGPRYQVAFTLVLNVFLGEVMDPDPQELVFRWQNWVDLLSTYDGKEQGDPASIRHTDSF